MAVVDACVLESCMGTGICPIRHHRMSPSQLSPDAYCTKKCILELLGILVPSPLLAVPLVNGVRRSTDALLMDRCFCSRVSRTLQLYYRLVNYICQKTCNG